MKTVAELDAAARASGEFDARPDAPPPVDPHARPPTCAYHPSRWASEEPGCASCSDGPCPWGDHPISPTLGAIERGH